MSLILPFCVVPRKKQPVAYYSHVITSDTVTDFSSAFYAHSLIDTTESPSVLVGPEELINLFKNASSDILDHVAPYKLRRHKTKTQPWLNENTRLLRRKCRKAEWKWQKDKLQVSYEVLRECLSSENFESRIFFRDNCIKCSQFTGTF